MKCYCWIWGHHRGNLRESWREGERLRGAGRWTRDIKSSGRNFFRSIHPNPVA